MVTSDHFYNTNCIHDLRSEEEKGGGVSKVLVVEQMEAWIFSNHIYDHLFQRYLAYVIVELTCPYRIDNRPSWQCMLRH